MIDASQKLKILFDLQKYFIWLQLTLENAETHFLGHRFVHISYFLYCMDSKLDGSYLFFMIYKMCKNEQ